MYQTTYPPLVILSAFQLRELIASEVAQAIVPLVAQLEAVERRLAQPRLRYTTYEIAALYGVKARSVREWINHGRVDKRGTLRLLTASELTRGKYSISLENAERFFAFFE